MGGFDDLFASLSPDNHVRGAQFERICKWYLENDPEYAARLTKVWPWKQWPGREVDVDTGIDLVAEDTDGNLWAIQSKGYGEDRPIPKAELNKFLAASSTRPFAYRLLISTTTNGLHHLAQRNIAEQDKPVFIRDRSDLRASRLPWPKHADDLSPPPPLEPAQPREHQLDPIQNVVDGFTTSDRGQLIMACGTGKTLTAWFIREKLSAERTLVLVPSLSLLKQTMREWLNATGGVSPFAALPVCSDASVSASEDELLAHVANLGVPPETRPEAIAAFLRKRGPRVIFSTYHSSPQIAEAFRLGRVPAFDLVVADESHRVAGPVRSAFATVLDAEKIKAKRRLFMTATPRIYSDATRRVSKDENFEYASMDDHAKFGPVFHRLSFGEAIERELLTRYRVAIVAVDNATYMDWTRRRTFVTLGGKKPLPAHKAASQIGLAKAMKKFDLRRTISFHSTVRAAQDFSASLENVIEWMPRGERPPGELWARHVSGEMDAGKRGRLIQCLATLAGGERGLLSNARCLAEGVDVPNLDCVAFIDPRRSEVDIVQAVGRAIRKSDEKTQGTIVIPVFVEDGDDPETVLAASAFKPVWDVFRALRSHDDELGRQLDTLRREMGSEGRTPQLPPNIHTDVPKSVGSAFSAAFSIRLVEQTTLSWEFWFGLLERYVAERGDARVRTDYKTKDGRGLGSWVNSQRVNYRNGLLSAEQQALLEAVHPAWSWNPQDDQWEEGFRYLAQFVDLNGHARVLANYKTSDGFRLGGWVRKQRMNYHDGALSPERQRMLEEIHPTWMWDALTESWEEGFQHLRSYVEQYGHARVHGGYQTADGFKLGHWVARQRSVYNKGSMSPGRQERIEAVHPTWSWNIPGDRWQEGFEYLLAYVEENDSARVPVNHTTADGFKLGQWVLIQRMSFRAGTLERKYQERLTSIHSSWSWNTREDRWGRGFSHLRTFVETHDHARVPSDYVAPDGFRLGSWASTQRSGLRSGKLPAERQAQIENLHPTWSWDALSDRWEEHYALLREYVRVNGHAQVPSGLKTAEGIALGSWVGIQRSRYAKGKLERERLQRLEAVHPTWTWAALEKRWERAAEYFRAFVEQNGHALVPTGFVIEGFKLGSWISKQRNAFRNGTLEPDRSRRLDAVCPDWSLDVVERRWDDGLRHLRAYVKSNGHARVPGAYVVDGFALGVWVATYRRAYLAGELDEQHRQTLEKTHPTWSWDIPGDKWSQGREELERYVAEYGTAAVAVSYVTADGYRLGYWVGNQRAAYGRGELSAERAGWLKELPGWAWNQLDANWEEGMSKLSRYAAARGDTDLPNTAVFEGYRVGGWASRQRTAYAKGTLDGERQKRLEALPNWSWNPLVDKWERAFRLMEQYVAEHGNALVPDDYTVDGVRLGSWVGTQRSLYKKGNMAPERVRRLGELPGWVWKGSRGPRK